MILYIIRHAWAGEYGDPRWPDDRQRPLDPAGRERFAAMVALLAARGFAPQLIASSPLVRCVETAGVVAEGLDQRPQIVERAELEPQSDLPGLVKWTAKQAAEYERIAWVGHAPDVGWLTASLIGSSGGSIHFSKGAVAAIEFDDRFDRGAGMLRWLATAKLLGV